MDDFKRRPAQQRPISPSTPPVEAATPKQPVWSEAMPSAAMAPQPIEGHSAQNAPASQPLKKSKKRRIFLIIFSVLGLLLVAIGAIVGWGILNLRPVDSSDTSMKLVTIESGSTPQEIATNLADEGLIKNETVFLWYARLKNVENLLQAGSYRLSPSESTQDIVAHLANGTVDTFSITFLPGATLADNRQVLLDAGYSVEEVDAALSATYDTPLFEGKPALADLEGYIYGETYSFGTNTSVQDILLHTFEEFYSVVEANDLVAKYKAHGLTLFQGITLASIVQREASPAGNDMPTIAQVFYNRLAIDMQLGSDVTYQYIADKTGVQRDPNLDSPYNTRRYTGLPPGPISAPGKKALIAVANPTTGDYLYFLSGDDNITYFAHSLEQHEANIKNHCQEKCQIL